jgi:hypothetical protein
MRECDEGGDIQIDDLELTFEIEFGEIARRSETGIVY